MSMISTVQQELSYVLRNHNDVPGASLALIDGFEVHSVACGLARVLTAEPLTESHSLPCSYLAHTVAAAFAIEYFTSKGVPLTSSVNALLAETSANWRVAVASSLRSLAHTEADRVTLAMLLNHTAFYVTRNTPVLRGIPFPEGVPPLERLLNGSEAKNCQYEALFLEREPGERFSFSVNGFLVLQYLIESREGGHIDEITRPFLDSVGLQEFAFSELSRQLETNAKTSSVIGHYSRVKEINPRLVYPSFAAGAVSTSRALASFLAMLAKAYKDTEGCGGISHTTARLMLGEKSLCDLGAAEYIGGKMGFGTFVARAGDFNRIMLYTGANEGFRGVYMLCFDGPDAGKGFVLLSNGEDPNEQFICQMSRFLLGPRALNMQGIDFSQFEDKDGRKQSEGLKNRVVNAFVAPTPYCSIDYYQSALDDATKNSHSK